MHFLKKELEQEFRVRHLRQAKLGGQKRYALCTRGMLTRQKKHEIKKSILLTMKVAGTKSYGELEVKEGHDDTMIVMYF